MTKIGENDYIKLREMSKMNPHSNAVYIVDGENMKIKSFLNSAEAEEPIVTVKKTQKTRTTFEEGTNLRKRVNQ